MTNTATKSLRIERLLNGMRSDLARLYRRRATGVTVAATVSGGSADDEIAVAEAAVARYESMLADALRAELVELAA